MEAVKHSFTTWDGHALSYRAWLPDAMKDQPAGSDPQQASPRKAILLFHRGHEHGGRWQATIDALNLPDVAVFAWDQRGHGDSFGERGCAPDIAAVARDADWFSRHIAQTWQIQIPDMIVIAHSVGAVVVTTWIHDYAPPVRAMVLGAPAFDVKLYIPLAIPALRLRQKLLGHGYVKSYVKSTMLTHDAEQARLYQEDKTIFRQIAVNVLLDLYDTSKRVVADAGAIVTPTLLLAAGSDFVVKLGVQRKFFEALSTPIKRMEVLPGFYHAIFHEKGRKLVCEKMRTFIVDRFAAPRNDLTSLGQADDYGYTRHQYDQLCEPSSLKWKLLQKSMKTVCRLSKGISLGWSSGFDSGVTLDYVYENRAQGITPLGKLIDFNYLNSPGWRGIRQRRVNLQQLLAEVIGLQTKAGERTHIVDIAAGAGRYVLSSMAEQQDGNASGSSHESESGQSKAVITAHLRDYREQNLETARATAKSLNVTGVTFEVADAFERASLAALTPKPTIGIVSGLFELFPSNAPLRAALGGLADAIESGGYLIYTNQPWHPQAEFIARVLTNREGQPWIMRCRTQAEMDELVRAAGFQKIKQDIDTWGIFSVSVARRV